MRTALHCINCGVRYITTFDDDDDDYDHDDLDDHDDQDDH